MPGKDDKAYKGWRGTIKAALDHHPDKFSKEACGKKKSGKLCPYAVFTAMKEKGDTPHYKEQPHTTSGTPHKKKEFKNESEICSFKKYAKKRDLTESSSKEYQQGYGAGKAGHDEPCPYKDDVQRSDWLNGYEDGFKYAKWDDKDKPNWNKPKKMSVSSLNANFDLP
jgi:ribosome modulation factor